MGYTSWATNQLDFASGQKIWDWVGGYQPVLLHLILIHEYLTFSQDKIAFCPFRAN